MKRKILLTSTMLFFFVIAFAMITGINGKWAGVLTRPDGSTSTLNYTFNVDNGKLTGRVEGRAGDYDLSDGKINGDSLSFTVVVDDGSQLLNTGKYYSDGDSISLNMSFMGHPMHATLKRNPR